MAIHIVVSNRLPVSVAKINGNLEFTASPGGLATAMNSIKNHLWIGWPGIASDDLTARDRVVIKAKLRTYNCIPVFLTADQIDKFYNGYANGVIWPLFHYFSAPNGSAETCWQGYQRANEAFCNVILRHASTKATIWIHDYHLMLLPGLVRQVLPEATIGFFLHTPFPSYEIFRTLPTRQQLLQGLLGADLIGFHIYDYARHFLSSVMRILGSDNSHGNLIVNDRIIKIDAFPIGIDYAKYVRSLRSKKTLAALEKVTRQHHGKKIILSVDRLDYSKGIPERLEAFEQFLAARPELHGHIALIVVAIPSRTEVERYQELRTTVEQTISRINGTYGTIDWTPISYQFRNLPFHEVLALYARADIALVTPLRDGMNLVAKEYVAAKQNTPGVLILSEMTGAINELPEALAINPADSSAIVHALQQALAMPVEEQLRRLSSMQQRLARYTVQAWSADFIDQLATVKAMQSQQTNKLLVPATEKKIIRQFKSAKKRLLLLDYDGTLRGFVSTPNADAARPSASLLQLIHALASTPDTTVCIVSGRPRDALQSWFGDMPIVLIAEHGAWTRHLAMTWQQQPASFHHYRSAIIDILQHYADRTPGATIEQKTYGIVWHYRNVPAELAYAHNAELLHELGRLLDNTDIGVYKGSKIIEIRAKTIHKGAASTALIAAYPSDFILCAGDDYTDEDMFAALPADAHSIKVGLSETHAKFQTTSVEKILQLLEGFV